MVVVTPLASDDSNPVWQERTLDHREIRNRYVDISNEIKQFILGPMPVTEFLEFLPATDLKKMPRGVRAFRGVPSSAKSGEEIVEKLLPVLNGIRMGTKTHSRCPGFVFKHTAACGADRGEVGSMNPTVCCYAADIVDAAMTDPAMAGSLGYADLFIEVQSDVRLDPFTDPDSSADRSLHSFILNIDDSRSRMQAEQALGRNVACATEACARQHRKFYFSISLTGSKARLIRWDRAGAIVSESLDLHDDPMPLCEFLWRYAHSSGSQRGYDPSVEPATREEEGLFQERVSRHVALQLGLEDEEALSAAVEEHYQPSMVAAIRVVDVGSATRQVRRLLVSRPVISPASLTGRGTRGYWAVSADEPRGDVVFLKDTWRFDVDRVKEGEILADLLDAGVPNIPLLVGHGDVPEQVSDDDGVDQGPTFESIQRTLTDQCQQAHWVCRGGRNARNRVVLAPYVHYRVILGTVGYGLKRFRGTQELLHATYDAFQAMLGAFVLDDPERRRLHRDISLGNIILARDPTSDNAIRRGYLIDWEISSLVTHTGEARKCEKVGTLDFMSIRLLSGRDVAHTIQDDMESMLWVVLYCTLLWLGHDQSSEDLARTVFNIYHLYDDVGHGIIGGAGKISTLHAQRFTSSTDFSCSAFREWLDSVVKFNASHFFLNDLDHAKVWENAMGLKQYWSEFLHAHTLPTDDRVHRQLPPRQTRRYQWSSSMTPTLLPPPPMSSAASSSRKRKAAAEPVNMPSKKTKTSARLVASRKQAAAAESLSVPAPKTGASARTVAPRKRKADDELIIVPSKKAKTSARPVVPRESYTGRMTRSMTRQAEMKGKGAGITPELNHSQQVPRRVLRSAQNIASIPHPKTAPALPRRGARARTKARQ